MVRRTRIHGNAIMLLRIAGILLPCAVALANSVAAQPPTPPPAAITRTVIATTKLPTVTEAPLHFRAVSVTLPPNDTSSVSGANGILYQLSGSTEVSVDDQPRTLNTGEGLFIAAGKKATLKAGSGVPSTFLHFIIAPVGDLDRPVEAAPATVRELYRTSAAIPDLKPGGYDLNLTRGYISAADAIQPAASSVGCGLVLHHLRNGREHGGRQDGGEGTRFIDL